MNMWTIFRKGPHIAGLLIICFIAVTYIPALNVYLIGDDFECLNAVYSGWEYPIVIFRTINLFFRPILQFSYLINYTLFKTHAPFYIATLIGLHLANVFLLYVLLLHTTGKIYLAGLTALLFGTSPIYSEATLWSGGHSDSLLMFFFLTTLLLHPYPQKPVSRKRQILILLSILGAIGSKGTWIILPFLLLSFLILILNYPLQKAIRSSILIFAGVGIYLVIVIVIPRLTRTHSPADYIHPNLRTMLKKLSYLLCKYAGLGDYFYGYWWQIGTIFVIMLSLVFVMLALKNRIALWGMGWMFLTVLITLPVIYAPSRYNYLPLAGFWIMIGSLVAQISAIFRKKFHIANSIVGISIILCVSFIVVYHTIMLQWEIRDYRRYGEAHREIVVMYNQIKGQISADLPIVFINHGTRRPIDEIFASLQGYPKLLYCRPQAIWQLIRFAPLANFAGEPFEQRMVAIDQERIEDVLQAQFQLLIFTDQGFLLGNSEACDQLRQFYLIQRQFLDNIQAYHFIPINKHHE